MSVGRLRLHMAGRYQPKPSRKFFPAFKPWSFIVSRSIHPAERFVHKSRLNRPATSKASGMPEVARTF